MIQTRKTLRIGCARGFIELRQSFSGPALIGQLFWPIATLVAIYFLRNKQFQTSGYTLGTIALPSVLGMFVAFATLLVLQYLAAEREDGTLLRAKTIPSGIATYFVGKLITVSGTILVYLLILLVPGLLIIHGLHLDRAYVWITFAWVLVLGLIATESIGAVMGSLISSPRGAGYMSVPVMGLIAISGIFYPIASEPHILQWIAQIFPMYWLGLGMRSALLPTTAVSVEIGESWRHLATFGVLGAWATVGLVLAPAVLRRMARRESGSKVAERHEMEYRRHS